MKLIVDRNVIHEVDSNSNINKSSNSNNNDNSDNDNNILNGNFNYVNSYKSTQDYCIYHEGISGKNGTRRQNRTLGVLC